MLKMILSFLAGLLEISLAEALENRRARRREEKERMRAERLKNAREAAAKAAASGLNAGKDRRRKKKG